MCLLLLIFFNFSFWSILFLIKLYLLHSLSKFYLSLYLLCLFYVTYSSLIPLSITGYFHLHWQHRPPQPYDLVSHGIQIEYALDVCSPSVRFIIGIVVWICKWIWDLKVICAVGESGQNIANLRIKGFQMYIATRQWITIDFFFF